MNGRRDPELLRDYAESGSEPAFAELVRRYIDLVYSAALRMLGNSHMAQEVTQAVFVALSQKARSLSTRPVLSGWLHRTAQNLAAKTVRAEVRRRAREKEAAAMSELNASEIEPVWDQIAPHLDSALRRLRTSDRDVVLLRFFEKRSMEEIARRLGLSEAAAQKRVSRALERLRNVFATHGITVSSVLIASVLGAHSVKAAPIGLAATVAGASINIPASAAGTFTSVFKLLAMTKLQSTAVGLLFLAGVATSLMIGSPTNSQARNVKAIDLTKNSPRAGQALASPAMQNSITGTVHSSAALNRLKSWLTDAERALSTKGFDTGNLDVQKLDFLIWSMPAADYPGAWQLGQAVRLQKLRYFFQRELVKYWADLDPRAVLAATESIDNRFVRSEAEDSALRAWAQKDPAAALAWARDFSPATVRDSRIADLIPSVAKTDPQAALAALEQLPSDSLRKRALSGLMWQWASQDPQAASRFLTNMPASQQRSELMNQVARTWGTRDSDAALAWANSLKNQDETKVVIGGVAGSLIENDPARAAMLLFQIGSSINIYEALQNWAQADLSAASGWVSQLPAGHFRDGAVAGLLTEWSKQDPAAATQWVAVLPGDKDLQVVPLQRMMNEWSHRDPQAALGAVNKLAAGPMRDAALIGFCQGFAQSKPEEAVNFVSGLPPGDVQLTAAVAAAGSWAFKDPGAAAHWVGTFPESPQRVQAAQDVISVWVEQDPAAAAEWLDELSPGASRDQAARIFVLRATQKEPELAARWVNACTDEAERNQQIEWIAKQWVATNPDAARKWLMSTSLPDEKKRELLGK